MDKKYFKLCLKRNLKLYPTIFLITLLTVISIVVACAVLLISNNSDEKQQKIKIGIVGDMQGTYMDIGLNVLKKSDTSNLYVDWIEMDENKAVKALKNRKINGYILIPDNYVRDIFRGKNTPAKYVMLKCSGRVWDHCF